MIPTLWNKNRKPAMIIAMTSTCLCFCFCASASAPQVEFTAEISAGSGYQPQTEKSKQKHMCKHIPQIARGCGDDTPQASSIISSIC